MPPLAQADVQAFFACNPARMALYRAAEQAVFSAGPCGVRVSKTQLSFANGVLFAYVWDTPSWARAQGGAGIMFSFCLPRRVEDARIKTVTEPYPARWIHHMAVTDATAFDAQVVQWLCEAYAYAGVRARARGRKN